MRRLYTCVLYFILGFASRKHCVDQGPSTTSSIGAIFPLEAHGCGPHRSLGIVNKHEISTHLAFGVVAVPTGKWDVKARSDPTYSRTVGSLWTFPSDIKGPAFDELCLQSILLYSQ